MKKIEIGVALIIENIESKKILIAKSPKIKEGWTIPGGHVEFGETIYKSIKREAKEEVGLVVNFKKIIRVCEAITSKPMHMISFHVLCETDNYDVTVDGRELLEYKWVTHKNALKLVKFEDFNRSIKEFINLET